MDKPTQSKISERNIYPGQFGPGKQKQEVLGITWAASDFNNMNQTEVNFPPKKKRHHRTNTDIYDMASNVANNLTKYTNPAGSSRKRSQRHSPCLNTSKLDQIHQGIEFEGLSLYTNTETKLK